MNKVILIGEGSRLSSSILNQNRKAILLPREFYSTWQQDDQIEELISNFKEGTIVINKAILDPKYEKEKIYHWNYYLPRFIIEMVIKHQSKCCILTIGSIHEHSGIENNYLNSKRELSNYIASLNDSRFKHVRLHTLYGEGMPISNMFLGQIFEALYFNKPFLMSYGMQYRQYHDYFHVAKHILSLIANWQNTRQFIDLNGVEWLRLKDIAKGIFEAFDKSHLLKIGKLSSVEEEIVVRPSLEAETFEFPKAIPGIVSYFNKTFNEKS